MKLCDSDKCTSCGACIDACPKGCISYKEDKFGFLYPQIDRKLCVECGACESVCHVLNEVRGKRPEKAYAVWSSDPEDRKTSTSGGAASVFYNTVLEEGGMCFGAAYDENSDVVIKGYGDHSNVRKFKNSKYVHSDMGDSYKQIKNLLRDGRKVIFIGLPCQVAALKTYLKRDYDKLLLVDLICHGTPPIRHLKEHIESIESNEQKHTEYIRFRDDNAFYLTLGDSNGCFYKKHKELDTYLLSFFNGLNYYESCYNCRYACNERVSDITVGDFWGLGLETPFNHPYSGAISLVLTNTEKGKSFFEMAKSKLFWEERTVDEALKGNAQLNRPTVRNKERDRFNHQYADNGFEHASECIYSEHIKKYTKILARQERKDKIRKFAKKLLRR
ncbi:MAG: Coenzyme F420 hydrogenase/dehydrogenase, beta subunit C-terminal domain [Eubacteriales bacterium]|nr:Coenzyme F420 hydrogenase/dehydrogenase, beta subunit C-terminal domain [Eubacteriales bacterium]